MTDPNTAPVTLAAGSFDYDALKSGLNKAARGSAKGYDGAVKGALEDAGQHAFGLPDARAIDGYKFVPVENEELGVTEHVQVFDAKLAEKEETTDNTPDVPPVAAENLAAAKTAADTKE